MKRILRMKVIIPLVEFHLHRILKIFYKYTFLLISYTHNVVNIHIHNTYTCCALFIINFVLSYYTGSLLYCLLFFSQAIGQENQKVEDKSSSMLTVVNPTAPPPPLHLSPRPNMAFSAMTQKIKETSHKIKTRATELSTMIERETLSINLFELQPLTEYGIYMRSFGQANTCQVNHSYN